MAERSDWEKKFDRQIRLWGLHGQRRLEATHIAVLNSSATATETLKNLCLANIKEFTLIDDAKLTETDLGNNFFVDATSLGKPRAEVVTSFLLEMNPDVNGHSLNKSVNDMILNEIEFFDRFQLIIATQMSDFRVLQKLASYCYERKIAFVVARSYGLLGYLRIAHPEHNIVETKPADKDLSDLFLHPSQLAAFPELAAFIDSFDLAALDTMEHGHVPYAVLLGKHMQAFYAQYGHAPLSDAEKVAFQETLRTASLDFVKRHKPEKVELEQNYEEAIEFAYKAWAPPKLSDEVKSILGRADAVCATNATSDFWLVAKALSDFVAAEGCGCLPVSPEIPDMHSDTAKYVALKKIYLHKHQQHVAQISARVAQLCAPLDRQVPALLIDRMVKFCRSMESVCIRSLDTETEAPEISNLADAFCPPFVDEDEIKEVDPSAPPKPVLIHWYLALKAVDQFFLSHGRLPAAAKDAVVLKNLAREQLIAWGIEQDLVPACLDEIVRWNGVELHNTAAFIGGVASQEAIKLILEQFVPLNNTFIYDGIYSQALTIEL